MALLIKPEFIERDPAKIQAEIKAQYEAISGRTIQPAQTEMLLFNAFAYREALIRQSVNDAYLSMLVAFSQAPVLDYLGELVGVTRLSATRAAVPVKFEIVPGHNGIVIPAGLRVESKDGAVIFSTNYSQGVAAGVTSVIVKCDCAIEGTAGNNYLPGEISRIIDPQPYITTAANTETTGGGATEETDDQLRVRIKQAPASYSNAGSKGAYIFHAKSANPSIIDVAVISPSAGIVTIYPLVRGGIITPAEVLADVAATCSGEKVRPLTDTVLVEAPVRVDYALNINLTLFPNAIASVVATAVEANVRQYTEAKAELLGQDIVLTQIIPQLMVEGVYKAELPEFADIVIDETSYAFCTGIAVNIIGTNAG